MPSSFCRLLSPHQTLIIVKGYGVLSPTQLLIQISLDEAEQGPWIPWPEKDALPFRNQSKKSKRGRTVPCHFC